jgi:hypothetical protein
VRIGEGGVDEVEFDVGVRLLERFFPDLTDLIPPSEGDFRDNCVTLNRRCRLRLPARWLTALRRCAATSRQQRRCTNAACARGSNLEEPAS